jgi:hypothetical protein
MAKKRRSKKLGPRKEYREAPKWKVSGLLASLSSVTGDLRGAEAHMLDLLAMCAFGSFDEESGNSNLLSFWSA